MDIKLKRIIWGILIILNCIVIFNFSSQDSEKSTQTSGVVVNRVVNTITTVNKKVKKETIKEKVTFVVRKIAHFSIYTLLGFFLINFVNTFNMQTKRKILLSIILGMCYASSDEFHQSFVGGRSPEVRDVIIDTCGIIFGIFIGLIIKKIISKYNAPKKLAEKNQ